MDKIDVIIIAVYFLGMLGIGFFAQSKIKDLSDFVLGGAQFGYFGIVGTIMATMMGTGMVMGVVSNVYSNGITGNAIWIYGGFIIGLVLMGFMSKKIRDTKAKTLSEVISKSFGKEARLVSGVIVVLYSIGILALTISGMRILIIEILGNVVNISPTMATIIATLIAVAYTAIGGFYAVILTDTLQLVLIIVAVMIIGPIIALSSAGGYKEIISAYASSGGSFTNPLAHGFSFGMLGVALSYIFASPSDPSMPQRALAAKSDKVAKNSFFIAAFIGIFAAIAMITIGGSVFTLMPDLANPDSAFPSFILNYYPKGLKGLTLAALLAAVMSTYDTFLVLGSSHLIYDIGSVIKPDLEDEKIKKILPFTTIIFGAISLVVALYITSILEYMAMIFSVISPAVFPVLVAGLWFKDRVSKTAAIGSMIIGTLVPGYLFVTKGYDVFLGDPVFLGLIASTLTIIIFSMLFKDKDKTNISEVEDL